jgi:hypothetical protein
MNTGGDRAKDHVSTHVALQRHEMKRYSPPQRTIGTVVAKLTRAFDNRFVT